MGGGLGSRCVGRVYGADGAVRVALHHPQKNKTTLGTVFLGSLRMTD